MNGNICYSDWYYTQEAESVFAIQSAYIVVDAGVRLFTESERWQVALIGRNLNNERYATASADASNGAPGTVDSTISRPRQITLELSSRF